MFEQPQQILAAYGQQIEGVAGCDDAHMTPYEQYINMLRDERKQFDKILSVLGQMPKEEVKVLGELPVG
jgi:hypothetical protein